MSCIDVLLPTLYFHLPKTPTHLAVLSQRSSSLSFRESRCAAHPATGLPV
jgi:hypothetical protein